MVGTLVVQNLQGPAAGANANKIIVPAGQVLDASAGFVAPAGSVIQCITNTATVGNAGGGGTDIQTLTISATGGFGTAISIQSLNITPKFSTSKILVQWTGQMRMNSTGAGGIQMFFGKDGSNLLTSGGNYDAAVFMYAGPLMNDFYQSQSAQYSFTAGQTTQMTLDVRMNCYNTAAQINLSHDGLESLTAWEIAQ